MPVLIVNKLEKDYAISNDIIAKCTHAADAGIDEQVDDSGMQQHSQRQIS